MELGDDDVLVRGGLMQDRVQQLQALQDVEALCGHYDFSVWANPGLTVGQLCAESEIPHKRVRLARVGDIRSLGFEIIEQGDPNHFDIRLPGSDLTRELDSVIDCFADPIERPEAE